MALQAVFGVRLRTNALLPEAGLEARSRQEVLQALEAATKDCGREAYSKGGRSYQVLAQLNPEILGQRLPHFRRFVEALDRRLK